MWADLGFRLHSAQPVDRHLTRHPGTLYDATNSLAGRNPSNRAVEHACRNCHQSIHGSNAPSGPYLGR